MQKAVIARTSESFGQNVLQDQAQEVGTAQAALPHFPALAVAVAKADLPASAAENVAFAQHTAIEVAPEIDQRLFAIADAFAVDDPFRRQLAGQRVAFRLQCDEQLTAKDLGQRLVIEEVAGLGSPVALPGVKRRRRHRQVNVRVKFQPSRVGMQHRHRTGFALEFPVVLAKGLHGGPGGGEERGVDGFGLADSKWPQFLGQGEGEQEILGGHLQTPLAFQPDFAFVMLAMRTAAMAAGVRNQPLFVAGAACRQ